jgi:hypothetical protein
MVVDGQKGLDSSFAKLFLGPRNDKSLVEKFALDYQVSTS